MLRRNEIDSVGATEVQDPELHGTTLTGSDCACAKEFVTSDPARGCEKFVGLWSSLDGTWFDAAGPMRKS